MKVTSLSNDQQSITTGKDVQMHTFGITDSAVFLHNLSDTLYSDKLLACIREPICNAWDAHVEAGIADTPIEITITGNEVIVKDFGKGISIEEFPKVYGIYGYSSKQNDINQTGGFGLGCKAPFAYTESFTVTSAHAGTKTIYALNKSSIIGGKPSISKMAEVPTEESGLTVTIPMQTSNMDAEPKTTNMQYALPSLSRDRYKEIKRIYEMVLSICATSQQEAKINFDLLDLSFIADNMKDEVKEGQAALFHPRMLLKEGQDIFDSYISPVEDNRDRVFLLYSNVIYPVDSSKLNYSTAAIVQKLYNDIYHYNKAYIAIRATPGRVHVTPSRESLSYQDETVDYLNEVILEAVTNLYNEIQDIRLGLKDNFIKELKEKGTVVNDMLTSISNFNAYKALLNTHYSYTESTDSRIIKGEYLEDFLRIVNSHYLASETQEYFLSLYAKEVGIDNCINHDLEDVRVFNGAHINKAKDIRKKYNKYAGKRIAMLASIVGDKNRLFSITPSYDIASIDRVAKKVNNSDNYFANAESSKMYANSFVYLFGTKAYLSEHINKTYNVYSAEFNLDTIMDPLESGVFQNNMCVQLPIRQYDKYEELVAKLEENGITVIDLLTPEKKYKDAIKAKRAEQKKLLEKHKKDNPTAIVEEVKKVAKPSHVRCDFHDYVSKLTDWNRIDPYALPADFVEAEEDSHIVFLAELPDFRGANLFNTSREIAYYNSNVEKLQVVDYFLRMHNKRACIVTTTNRYDKAIEEGMVSFEDWIVQVFKDLLADSKYKDYIGKCALTIYCNALVGNYEKIVDYYDRHKWREETTAFRCLLEYCEYIYRDDDKALKDSMEEFFPEISDILFNTRKSIETPQFLWESINKHDENNTLEDMLTLMCVELLDNVLARTSSKVTAKDEIAKLIIAEFDEALSKRTSMAIRVNTLDALRYSLSKISDNYHSASSLNNAFVEDNIMSTLKHYNEGLNKYEK